MKSRPVKCGRLSLMVALSVGALMVSSSLSLAAGNVAMGKKLYTSDCAVCHKANGAGGVKLGASTSASLQAPALEKMYKHSDKLLARAILDGKDEEGGSLDAIMPRWRGRLTDEQVTDLIAYLKTLHK